MSSFDQAYPVDATARPFGCWTTRDCGSPMNRKVLASRKHRAQPLATGFRADDPAEAQRTPALQVAPKSFVAKLRRGPVSLAGAVCRTELGHDQIVGLQVRIRPAGGSTRRVDDGVRQRPECENQRRRRSHRWPMRAGPARDPCGSARGSVPTSSARCRRDRRRRGRGRRSQQRPRAGSRCPRTGPRRLPVTGQPASSWCHAAGRRRGRHHSSRAPRARTRPSRPAPAAPQVGALTVQALRRTRSVSLDMCLYARSVQPSSLKSRGTPPRKTLSGRSVAYPEAEIRATVKFSFIRSSSSPSPSRSTRRPGYPMKSPPSGWSYPAASHCE